MEVAAAADAGDEASVGAAARAGLPEARVWDRAAGAQRRLAGAGTDGRPLPQREHHAQERAHAPHRGCPVVLDTMQGAVRPHMLQVAVLRGTQLAQTGPSALRVLTGADAGSGCTPPG